MVSHESRYLLLTFIAGMLVLAANARHWDFAMVIGREINFFTQNQTLTTQAVIANASSLRAMAYDDATRTMFLTDTISNVSIFSVDLAEKNLTTRPLLNKENGSEVLGLAFDTSSRTLFWTDALKHVIMKMYVPINGRPETPVLLHNLSSREPNGIALDACNRRIYWANSNSLNPSIESSKLDGSDRITIVSDNLRQPLAVAIDHQAAKLYWSDDDEGIHFKIERSNLDGSDRQLLLKYQNNRPVYLTVDNDLVYWTDWVHTTIWTMKKNKQPSNHSDPVKFNFEFSRNADPCGIIARDNVGSVDCAAMAKAMESKTKSANYANFVTESFNNLTTSTEESHLIAENSRHCLNDGRHDKANTSCSCKPGFAGSFCEISLCHNYCLHGICVLDKRGLPLCDCETGFAGRRCEKNVCDGYCLHNGECSLKNGAPFCECKFSNKGPRCETTDELPEICAIFCASSQPNQPNVNVEMCRCQTNHTAERIISFSDNFEYNALLPILAALVVLLILLIIVLTYYVNKLRQRPRIKKRFVVSKGGITPLTSRPQIPDNQCEITIENCCNMNICETPCFEPKLRTAAPRGGSAKKEEKNSLLDNMEGNSC